ncbi:SDR family NAD(P)-dependent oxidoreductase [Paracoccus lutimaris]|uniref:Meso-butanediol dehydrogenase/(S,S)-butanediol dehydrogenase/diacetyl reductase n=1 Tax=Paracoccus lutimaris TaxID=1490030 RepID=A0A368YVE4_9RHOB|nr:glucose 1-dehydrogenase [Paracoccus lutimaris]RCW84171.1 meso-butanediol dehydrogenase/(S,S)-butanediol dehydrogenase/diacetyl reductase [Paracoccus lutimaris]
MAQKKTVIVTGAGTGIGRATALRFARDGYNVVLNGRGHTALDAVAEEIGDHAAVLVAPGDVAKRGDARQVVDAALAKFGGIDVMVNNAGVVNPGAVDMLGDDDFESMMAINVGGVRNMVIAALPALRKSRGNIVNVSSVSGMRGDWAMQGYNASKGAVSLMTQGMALDLGKEGIRVNAVAPATTNTRLAAPIQQAPKLSGALNRRIPMGRLAEADEVANVIAFLAGPDASFVNGVILPVDGGLSASNGQPDFTDQ